MEAPPERGGDQGVRRGPKGPVNFVTAVTAAKPSGGFGADADAREDSTTQSTLLNARFSVRCY